jgi:hypothetical protein
MHDGARMDQSLAFFLTEGLHGLIKDVHLQAVEKQAVKTKN